jgi:hypothetical protein
LHRFFDRHADKIGKELLSLSKPVQEDDTVALHGKRAWDGLCTLLVDFGPPYAVPRPAAQTRIQHAEYQSLIERKAGRDTSEVADIFVTVPTPEVPIIVVLSTLEEADNYSSLRIKSQFSF